MAAAATSAGVFMVAAERCCILLLWCRGASSGQWSDFGLASRGRESAGVSAGSWDSINVFLATDEHGCSQIIAGNFVFRVRGQQALFLVSVRCQQDGGELRQCDCSNGSIQCKRVFAGMDDIQVIQHQILLDNSH